MADESPGLIELAVEFPEFVWTTMASEWVNRSRLGKLLYPAWLVRAALETVAFIAFFAFIVLSGHYVNALSKGESMADKNGRAERSILGPEIDRQALELPRWLTCPECESTAIDLVTVELQGECFSEGATQSFFECHECGEDSLCEGPQPDAGYPE